MKLDVMSDRTILAELGQRVQRERLNRNMAQAELATLSGISRRALQNLEGDGACTLGLLIRILRALGRLDAFEAFLPDPGLSPVQLAKLRGRERLRASRPRRAARH